MGLHTQHDGQECCGPRDDATHTIEEDTCQNTRL